MRAEMGAPKEPQEGAETVAQHRLADDRPNPPRQEPARFGFTATKKLGNAVVRNRIRRRLKEAVRLAAPDHARPDCDYVLIAREAAATRPFAALEKDLVAALAAIHTAPDAGARLNRGEPRSGARKTTTTRGRAQRPGPASEG
jgi:ribonuclease P protein component